NTFSGVQRALEYEQQRQTKVLDAGEKVVQETRRWDENRKETIPMRSKEEAEDYRYYPDPNLVYLHISKEWIEEVRRSLPEMPDARKERYVREYGLPEYDAGVL